MLRLVILERDNARRLAQLARVRKRSLDYQVNQVLARHWQAGTTPTERLIVRVRSEQRPWRPWGWPHLLLVVWSLACAGFLTWLTEKF